LLFAFERYELGSFYFLIFIAAIITVIVGKLLTRLFPSHDPMQTEIEKENEKVRANQYQHEIKFIFNIVQPDPKLQPSPKRVTETLDECFGLDPAVMVDRLKQYFGESFDVATNQALPDMVEEMKQKYRDWPS